MLSTDTVAVWDVMCPGHIRGQADEECAASTHLVFPYRGVYVHHVGRSSVVVDTNQVLFINSDEPYRVSHPVGGGDRTVSVRIDPEAMREMTPPDRRHPTRIAAFDRTGIRADAHTQRLAATLRQRLGNDTVDMLEAEELTLGLARHVIGGTTWGATRTNGAGPRRLADRVKVLMSADIGRRWTLGDAAEAIGVSPVYLTQAFKRAEGVPLYRYHLRLRLTRALEMLAACDDVTTLAFDLGFTSHSHFTAAFKKVYGLTPSAYRRTLA